jgi:hypothetical protein
MIEPAYVPYEQYRAAKTRCGLDSRIYGNSSYNQWSTRYKNKLQFVLLERFGISRDAVRSLSAQTAESNLRLSHECAEKGQKKKPTAPTVHYCPHHSNVWSLCPSVHDMTAVNKHMRLRFRCSRRN